MKVLYVYADSPQEWNCSQHNCIVPAKSVNKTGIHTADTIHINDFVSNTEQSQKLCSEADIIIIERNFFGDTLTMIQFWKVRGKTIIAIFDDAYDLMHPKNVSHDFWNLGELKFADKDGKEQISYMNPKPLVQFVWGLKMVKAVQVPSVNLAKDWGKYNQTYYIHNYLDMDNYLNAEPLYPHPKDEIVIGWAGSMSHFASFSESGLMVALRKIGKKYPKVKFLFGGDKRIFDLVEVSNKIFQPHVPDDKWTSLLKTLDIGLAPLWGEYDKRRSWLKPLEYLAVKVPVAGTDIITYDDLKEHINVTENGSSNWFNLLSEMIENYPKYKEKAETTSFEFALQQSSYIKIPEVAIPLYQRLIDSPYP